MSDPRMPDFEITDIGTLQRQLAESQAELAVLRQEQATLAHGISHDLRAPLRAIDTFSALVEAEETLAPPARAHVARVRGAAARMGRLLDALLVLSHANRAQLRPAPLDLALLVEWAGAELQEAEPARPLQMDAAPGLIVLGDERLLRMFMSQLVDNAWKFSRGRDRVCIRLTGERRGERLHCALHDQGCGFEMGYVDKIFQPFQRLHGPEQGGGDGLGLAIARRVVERHGGRLQATSAAGIGSSFHFDLPAAPASA